jgi:hypothetical protein
MTSPRLDPVHRAVALDVIERRAVASHVRASPPVGTRTSAVVLGGIAKIQVPNARNTRVA